MAYPDRDVVVGAGLSFVAGFVDAAGFIALAGLFTAHVTGNFVLIGAELVAASTGVLAKLLALPVFILAVAATRVIALALERRNLQAMRPLLLIEAALLVAFAVTGALLSPLGSPDGARAIVVGMLGVAAMGVQNGVGRLVIGHLAATTVMTVNVAQAAIDLTDRLFGIGRTEAATARLRRTLPTVLAFAVGALSGAFAVAAISFWCALLPVIVLVGLALTHGSNQKS